ncbi:MAG: hypothetical protein FJ086_05400 [Deltaproteobacteria bacterium]|nr:hypothetical protein [Deltaproteobacteria bacterium]
MTLKIQRGRQFAGDTSAAVPLFDQKGKPAGWLEKAADKLVSQDIILKLQGKSGPVTLATREEWTAFLAEHVKSAAHARGFAGKFGVGFPDFVELLDDAASSTDKGLTLDLTPGGALAQALSLDKMDRDYASKLAAGAPVKLEAPEGRTPAELQLAAAPAMGPDILGAAVTGTWDRDRAEQESWADFKVGNGAGRLFRDNTGPAPFAKLKEPSWQDAEAMALVDRFNLPLRLEVDTTTPKNPDGSWNFQDNDEMFRETYFDDKGRSLERSGASVRARVRFDNKPPYTVRRVLVQAKEGREVDPQTGRSVVRKFEKRWEGNRLDEAGAQAALMSGRDGDSFLAVSQKLYQHVKEAGTLPRDGQLRLEPRHVVLQKRRRSHMQLDALENVKSRAEGLQKEVDALKAAGQPVPPALESFKAKVDGQVALLTEARELLKRHGQYMPSGECFIISADRYGVYDPGARATPPSDLDDEQGLLGKGLHVEAEWDSAASDPFTQAVESIDKALAAAPAPANGAELQADRARLEAIRELFRADVATTVKLLEERLLKAGLQLDPAKKSKDERARDMMSAAASRPIYWL